MRTTTIADERLWLILGRRSIRAYTPEPVSDGVVHKLLEAAMAAPTAAAKEPWRFVVVRSRQQISEITRALPHGQMLASAALGVVVCGDLEKAHDHQLSYLLQDCSAAIENLLLAAHMLKLGACWLGVHPREDRMERLKKILHLPASVIPVACVSIGFPAETKEPHAGVKQEYVHYDQW